MYLCGEIAIELDLNQLFKLTCLDCENSKLEQLVEVDSNSFQPCRSIPRLSFLL